MIDIEDRLRQSLHAAAAATPVGPAPTLRDHQPAIGSSPLAPHRPRRRRLAFATAVALLVPVAGVSAAAAGGVLPQPFVDAMGFLRQEGVSPENAQLVGSLPGPAGKRFEVWRTTGTERTCLSIWFLPAANPPGAATPDVDGGASTCRVRPAAAFAAGRTLDSGEGGSYVFKYDAGPATSATLLLSDGTTQPTLVSDGLVMGWFPAPAPGDAAPTLTGTTAIGTVVGPITIDLPTGGTPR